LRASEQTPLRTLLFLFTLSASAAATLADPILRHGMAIDEAKKILKSAGASPVQGAYHVPWFEIPENRANDPPPDWPRHGHHEYFHLPNGTCVRLQVEAGRPPEPSKVVGFELAADGERYTGKFEWFDAGKAGLHTYPETLDLAQFRRAVNWYWPVAGVLVAAVAFAVWRKRRVATQRARRSAHAAR
jgi:hypothetical protein